MPNPGDELTQDQVNSITNWKKYAKDINEIVIDKGWHQGVDTGGQFEGWATEADSGYKDGFPLYAGVKINGQPVHLYWMPLTNEMKLAKKGEDPRKT